MEQLKEKESQNTKDKARGCGIILIILFWVWLIFNVKSCLFDNDKPTEKKQESTVTQVPEDRIYISAQELYAAYDANEVAADQKYKTSY